MENQQPERLMKEHCTGGEAVDEILSTNRAKFTGREKAGERERTGRRLNRLRIVIRRVEHARAAAVATEQQAPARRDTFRFHCFHHLAEIFVRRLGIAEVELYRLAHANSIGHRERARTWIEADQVADQK